MVLKIIETFSAIIQVFMANRITDVVSVLTPSMKIAHSRGIMEKIFGTLGQKECCLCGRSVFGKKGKG
jgi:hypothetical protein